MLFRRATKMCRDEYGALVLDDTGSAVFVEKEPFLRTADMERLRDILIIRLSMQKMSQREISKILGLSCATVSRRLRLIPWSLRRLYERGFLVGMTSTHDDSMHRSPLENAIHYEGASTGGIEITPLAHLPIDETILDQFRDVIICRLRRRRVPLRRIADVLGISHVAVHRRLQRIPEANRREYEKLSLT